MKIFFVRHGKTEWNLEGRLQGASGDSPLLQESLEEIRALGHYLSEIDFDAVYSSDLKRARKTAQLIIQESNNPKPIVYTSVLREWKLGRLEGSKIATALSIYPQQMHAFRHNLARFDADVFEAETVHKTTQRVRNFILSLNKDFKNVLLVGHGANFTASIRSLMGYEPARLRDSGGLDNASVTVLETKDVEHFHCLLWNDKSYTAENKDALIDIL